MISENLGMRGGQRNLAERQDTDEWLSANAELGGGGGICHHGGFG